MHKIAPCFFEFTSCKEISRKGFSKVCWLQKHECLTLHYIQKKDAAQHQKENRVRVNNKLTAPITVFVDALTPVNLTFVIAQRTRRARGVHEACDIHAS
ncbi:hypothetical protein LWI28_000081 [Acer negundo]|uniref:Uncharacterized protein n=1 Tax=Acer negundo TaxID=4023 RepID=A0AAD5IKX8_ACENE|nr:hypothetical protein LWI28_000081 [Acer negundo]KAK4842091.1 hypothetical protein QYF36_015562 [Acer negundo]